MDDLFALLVLALFCILAHAVDQTDVLVSDLAHLLIYHVLGFVVKPSALAVAY